MAELEKLFQKSDIGYEDAFGPYTKIDAHHKLGLGPRAPPSDFSWDSCGRRDDVDDMDDMDDSSIESGERMDEEAKDDLAEEAKPV